MEMDANLKCYYKKCKVCNVNKGLFKFTGYECRSALTIGVHRIKQLLSLLVLNGIKREAGNSRKEAIYLRTAIKGSAACI